MAAARRAAAAALRCVAATAKSAGIYPAPSSVTSPITHSPTCAAAARSSAVVCIAPRSASFFSIAPSNAAAASRSGAFCNVSPSSAAAASRSGAFVNVSPSSAAAPGSADVFSISPSAAPGSAVFFTISPSAAGSVAVINISPSSAAGSVAVINISPSSAAAPGSASFFSISPSSAAAPGSASFFSISPSAAAKAGSGAFHSSSASATNRATARMGFHAGSITRANRSHFKIQRRLNHGEAKKIPPEVLDEIHRIDAESLKWHKQLQEAVQVVKKDVSNWSANSKANKAEATWQMGKTALIVSSSIFVTTSISGYVVLKLVKFGGRRDTQEAAARLVEEKISELKEELETRMDQIIEKKDKEEEASQNKRKLELEEKACRLDKWQAELEVREALVSSKEAASGQQPKC